MLDKRKPATIRRAFSLLRKDNIMAYIFSTASCDSAYVEWLPTPNNIPVRGRSVLIKGKANIADKNFVTPEGVMTSVTDEEMAFLETLPAFNRKVEAGFYSISKKQAEVSKVVKNMAKKDKSAPSTLNDFSNASTSKDAVNS